MKVRVISALAVFAATGLAISAGGCSSTPAREQLEAIRSNPTPELQTLTQRPDDIDNQLTVTFDTNLRSFSRDVGVLFMLNRPSRLTPLPSR